MQGDGEQDGGGAWQDARAQGGGEEEVSVLFRGVVDGGVASSNCCFLEIPESCSQ